MINTFKQIRLTNVHLSGSNGRIEAGTSGSFAFLSELNAYKTELSSDISTLSGNLYTSGQDLTTLINSVSGALSGQISSSNSDVTNSINALSGTLSSDIASTGLNLDNRITSEVLTLNNTILASSGELKTYVDNKISGVIDLAPEALNTLNELAAALGDDENFASNLTNTLTSISGALSGQIESANAYSNTLSGVLQTDIDTRVLTSSQKQFSVLVPLNIENTGIIFPGSAFSSVPSVQVTIEGDVAYGVVIKNRTNSGFDAYFSDVIQENGIYLNIFASNQ